MDVPIRFWNTLTQRLEPFTPIEPGKVRMYCCGLTPYAPAHGGHGRTATTFDVLVRFLRATGLEVTYVRNLTDVDDKILAKAKELGEEPMTFSARMSALNLQELTHLGCGDPSHEPKVSEHIPAIVALVETLIAKGSAYAVETDASRAGGGRDVYFAVRSFEGYGKLSRRNVDDLLSGARVEVDGEKRDPLDFALWKGCRDEEWGWASPWGKGRPGWHIECSAMAEKFLGPHFDIHCGGMDLVFPHHENEIAQSEAAWGSPFAKVWLHGGFLTVDKEKMSKSLGNFVTIGDIVARNDPEAFRYFALGTHYRGPLNFDLEGSATDGERVTFPGLDEAERRVEYLYATLDGLARLADGAAASLDGPKAFAAQAKVLSGARARVLAALAKDLDTPKALAIVAELGKAANEVLMQAPKVAKGGEAPRVAAFAEGARLALIEACEPLGLLQNAPIDFATRAKARRLGLRVLDEASIDAKVKARDEARNSRDFARADALRAELDGLGIEVFDRALGTTWKVTL